MKLHPKNILGDKLTTVIGLLLIVAPPLIPILPISVAVGSAIIGVLTALSKRK